MRTYRIAIPVIAAGLALASVASSLAYCPPPADEGTPTAQGQAFLDQMAARWAGR